MCHSKWEQKSFTVIVISDAKKVKETLMTWLGGNTITETKHLLDWKNLHGKKPLN